MKTDPSPDDKPASRGERLFRSLQRLAREVAAAEDEKKRYSSIFDKGDLAALRRLEPGGNVPPTCWPFWRFALDVLEADDLIDLEDERSIAQWATLLRAAAELGALCESAGKGPPDLRLGSALALAEVNEQRLLQLLRADRARLPDLVRTACRQLKSRGQSVDLTDLGRLLDSAGKDYGEKVRRRVATDYFRTLNSESKKKGAASAA